MVAASILILFFNLDPDANHLATRMIEPVLEMKDVVKSYGDNTVLNGVSFQVRRGETKIIIGASGSGKSTLLKLAMGLERPDEGQILIESEDITKMRERDLAHVRMKIGMVFQESALFDSMTVRDNVAYQLHEKGTHAGRNGIASPAESGICRA